MKNSILIMMISLFAVTANAQNKEEAKVEKVIKVYVKAGDQNDGSALDGHLDVNYRIVMNQLFGSDAIAIVDKAGYVSKVESKEWGGDNREVNFNSIKINHNTAVAHVILKGEKATFSSLIMLVQTKDGDWKIISDTPTIQG